MHAAPHLGRVERPAALSGESPEAERLHGDRALRFGMAIALATNEEDKRAAQIDHGREHVREPEADILFAISHANRANKGTDVDEEVN